MHKVIDADSLPLIARWQLFHASPWGFRMFKHAGAAICLLSIVLGPADASANHCQAEFQAVVKKQKQANKDLNNAVQRDDMVAACTSVKLQLRYMEEGYAITSRPSCGHKEHKGRPADLRKQAAAIETVRAVVPVLCKAPEEAGNDEGAGRTRSRTANCSDITGTKDQSTSRRECEPRKDAAPAETSQAVQNGGPSTEAMTDELKLIDQLRKPAEIANSPEPTTPSKVFIRPPSHTALDLVLQEQMARLGISAPTDCDKSLRATIKQIDAKLLALQKQEPPWEPGPQVEVGSCTSRLHRLFGRGFGLSNTSIGKQVENREARGCLELKKAYLERACTCSSKGITMSTDEAIQDQTLEAAAAVRNIEARAREHGIPNGRIRALVARAAEIRDCYNIQTIETLRTTEQSLERELGSPQGLSPPPAGPP